MLDILQNSFQGIVKKFSGQTTISEKNVQEALEQIKTSLLDADVHIRVVRRFINQTLEEALGAHIIKSVSPSQMFIKLLHDKLCQLLGNHKTDIHLSGNPAVILMCGVQGSGKTTTSAKLAHYYKKQGKEVVLVAADITRPAAIEQLITLGQQISCKVYANPQSTSSIDVATEAYRQSKLDHTDILIVDTAGRTELNEVLLEEIARLEKKFPISSKVLVLDAMTGQTAVQIAKSFHDSVNITGLIMTKTDSDARGGALLSIKSIVDVPIHFLGTGETINDFEIFHPDRMSQRILGMGDVVSLVEKVQEQVNEEEAEKIQQKILKKTFTLQDYLEQFRQISQIGSIDKIAEMLPGMSSEQINKIDIKQMKREEAIILSMTMSERNNAKIIGASRRARIASGSGVSVANVHALLKKFEKTKTMMKKTLKNKKYQAQLFNQMNMQGV